MIDLAKLKEIAPDSEVEHLMVQCMGYRAIGGPSSDSWSIRRYEDVERLLGNRYDAVRLWYKILERVR